ncbi:hypothetical protein ACHMWU_29030 [Aeromicrobium sp. UC242_57]
MVSAAATLTCSYAIANAADGPYPGLPRYTQQGGWAGATQSGVTEAAKARQWMRVPIQVVAAFTFGKPVPLQPSDPWENVEERGNFIFLVSPVGSAQNYGISPEFTVRTVAFGSIPVEATVQLIQRRENGYPVPVVAKNRRQIWKNPPAGHTSKYEEADTFVADSLTVRVNRLAADGVEPTWAMNVGPSNLLLSLSGDAECSMTSWRPERPTGSAHGGPGTTFLARGAG